MANPDHLSVLTRGVDVWNAWRRKTRLEAPDLRGALLARANLTRANLEGCNLGGADLSGAEFQEAELACADLRGADLSSASGTNADLCEANLEGATLVGTYIVAATLMHANLTAVNLRGAHLDEADLTEADLSHADLTGASLIGARLVETKLHQSKLVDCRIYGVSTWNARLDGAKQSGLVISRRDEPEIAVDNIEVAQFIYLLLHNEKLRDIIETLTSKVVLILGRFTPERKRILDGLRRELRTRGYVPVMFDFEKPSSRNYTETVATLAHMARFVIADVTDAKVVLQELERIVPKLPSVPVRPIVHAPAQRNPILGDFRQYRSFLDVYSYSGFDELAAAMSEAIIGPAEVAVNALRDARTMATGPNPPMQPTGSAGG